jgi:hypothetical protein
MQKKRIIEKKHIYRLYVIGFMINCNQSRNNCLSCLTNFEALSEEYNLILNHLGQRYFLR